MFWFVLLDERSVHGKAVARRCPVQKSGGRYELFLYCERGGKKVKAKNAPPQTLRRAAKTSADGYWE